MNPLDLPAALAAELTRIREQLDALLTDSRASLLAARGSEGAALRAAEAAEQVASAVGALATRLDALERAHRERSNGSGCRWSEEPPP